MSLSAPPIAAVLLPLAVVCSACVGSRWAEPEEDSDTDSTATLEDTGWNALGWTVLSSEGDELGDCGGGDAHCEADIAQLSMASEAGSVSFDLRFEGSFPREAGSFELFFLRFEGEPGGYTYRFTPSEHVFYYADCAVDASPAKHEGCHWAAVRTPSSFVHAWRDDDATFRCSLELEELGYESQPSLLLGVMAAPFEVDRTADFTDRYLDALQVTSAEVQGLQPVAL